MPVVHVNKYDTNPWCDEYKSKWEDGNDVEGSGEPGDPGAGTCRNCLHAIIVYAKLAEQRIEELGMEVRWLDGKLYLMDKVS